jgi:hypothetical protein
MISLYKANSFAPPTRIEGPQAAGVFVGLRLWRDTIVWFFPSPTAPVIFPDTPHEGAAKTMINLQS